MLSIHWSRLCRYRCWQLPAVALLPNAYIKNEAQRLYYYQRLKTSRKENAFGEAQSEVEDRDGCPPFKVRNAFIVMSLRMLAKKLGLDKIDATQGRLSIGYKDRNSVSPRAFTILTKVNKSACANREITN